MLFEQSDLRAHPARCQRGSATSRPATSDDNIVLVSPALPIAIGGRSAKDRGGRGKPNSAG